MTIDLNWREYSKMIEMQGTAGACRQTPKAFTLPANGEDSGMGDQSCGPPTGTSSSEKTLHKQNQPP
jgi:hypothetical protein